MKKPPSEERFTPYTKLEIKEAMEGISSEWKLRENHLERSFAFKNFREALAFVNEVGRIAEEEKHHPDIHLRWGEVVVKLWTHSCNGLSKKDFVLARHIEAEYATHTRLKRVS